MVGIIVLADWLFYDRLVGVSLALFVCALALGAALMAKKNPPREKLTLSLCALALGAVPSLQAVNLLTLGLALTGLIVFTLILNEGFIGDLFTRLQTMLGFAARLPFRFLVDAVRMVSHHRRESRLWFWPASASGWVVPLGFSLVFIWLFAEANPMIGRWYAKIDLFDMMAPTSLFRIWSWGACALLCWPFLRVRARKLSAKGAPVETTEEFETFGTPLDSLFSEKAVFRSLMLFNLLFGMQNGLDAAFLWGGATLPEGMTYASYAHRGAYTLIFTALLAAGFVLFAVRPGAPSENSSRVRMLLLIWTAQNAVLVHYSVLRLNLYVDAYALTYWRLAALAWMVLVFAGLVLIFLKFYWGKSVRWLINANLVCLMLVLFGAANANFPEWIANHNTRPPEPGKMRGVDAEYLVALGPAALPAVDRVLAYPERFALGGSKFPHAQALLRLKGDRAWLVRRVDERSVDWRSWGWRHARAKSYLATLHTPKRLAPWSPAQ
ncbi:MAG: DUF4173 domain-containing protein [Rhodobacteraceae bacterium]|nr:DUF4173 domain-containing protein [Paracoccaceae bacterium]